MKLNRLEAKRTVLLHTRQPKPALLNCMDVRLEA